MFIYVDESGDPGMKLNHGSSPYFIIALVIFENNQSALEARVKIKHLRKRLFKSATFEFHFSRTSKRMKDEFFAESAGMDFCYYGIVIDKAKLWHESFNYPKIMLGRALTYVFNNARGYLKDAEVILDRMGSDSVLRIIQREIGEKFLNDPRISIRSIEFTDSAHDELVQLADMVCGAIAEPYNKPFQKRRYYEHKILMKRRHIQKWPWQ